MIIVGCLLTWGGIILVYAFDCTGNFYSRPVNPHESMQCENFLFHKFTTCQNPKQDGQKYYSGSTDNLPYFDYK